jgi:hypothetical protein
VTKVSALDLTPRAAEQRRTVTFNIARFWAGATPEQIIDTLLPDLKPYYSFVVSDAPQVLLYGPYS